MGKDQETCKLDRDPCLALGKDREADKQDMDPHLAMCKYKIKGHRTGTGKL